MLPTVKEPTLRTATLLLLAVQGAPTSSPAHHPPPLSKTPAQHSQRAPNPAHFRAPPPKYPFPTPVNFTSKTSCRISRYTRPNPSCLLHVLSQRAACTSHETHRLCKCWRCSRESRRVYAVIALERCSLCYLVMACGPMLCVGCVGDGITYRMCGACAAFLALRVALRNSAVHCAHYFRLSDSGASWRGGGGGQPILQYCRFCRAVLDVED